VLISTAQTITDQIFIGNFIRTTSWLALIIGMMQRPIAAWAPASLQLLGKIDINAVKEMKKADFLNKFW
jgi:hypothetical protein